MSAEQDITEGLDEIRRSAFVSGNTKKSYRQASPQESPRVFSYLDGGTEPSPFPTTLMGSGLTKVERGRRALSPTPPPPDEYTYRFATLNPATDKITGCLNRFQPSYSWWVPGSPDGTSWPDGGGVHPVSHPTYGPGLNRVTTSAMLYGNATTGPKDSNISRFAIEPRLVDTRLQYLEPGSLHKWETTIMRPSGFTWMTSKQYEGVWAYSWTNNGFNTVGHHIYLNNSYHWPGFSYYFGHQYLTPTESPPQTVLWRRYNCPLPFDADEYHTIRWEILHSDLGVPNGSVKCWTSVDGGPFQQWLDLTNVLTLLSGFSQNYMIYCTLRTPLNNPTMSLHQYNTRVLIA